MNIELEDQIVEVGVNPAPYLCKEEEFLLLLLISHSVELKVRFQETQKHGRFENL